MEIIKLIVQLITVLIAIWLYISGWYRLLKLGNEKFKFLKIFERMPSDLFNFIWIVINTAIAIIIFVWGWY